jgi:DNA-binding XRE family transcriptional regulator
MPENNVRHFREKAKLSQRELAAKVGTSQQQIQRIEAGVQAVRLDLAADICKALNTNLGEVFPQAELPIARAKKRGGGNDQPLLRLHQDEASSEELENAGLDADPKRWIFRFALRNGFEADLLVSGPDYSHLWRRVQFVKRRNFLVFDSGDYRYAINGDHLLFCQFLFEARQLNCWEVPEGIDDRTHTWVYLATREKPFEFGLDLAEGSEDEDSDINEWQYIFMHLDGLFQGADEVDQISFLDEDGERAFFRTDDVALIKTSLTAVEADVADAMMRGYEEEESANARSDS